jgi:hypothetical protein
VDVEKKEDEEDEEEEEEEEVEETWMNGTRALICLRWWSERNEGNGFQ